MQEPIAQIFVSSYDAANLTSLTNDAAASRYVAALQAAYPDAELHIVSGSLECVSARFADGFPLDDQRIAEMREIIGRVWEQLTIDYPWSDND